MRNVLVLALVLLVSACGPRLVQTDVTRFHQLPPVSQVRSFTILPQQEQRGSLEFQRYADLVAGQLQRHGWSPVPASQNADAVVFLNWGVGQPRTETWTSPSTGIGMGMGMGWGSRSRSYGLGMGFPLGDPFPYREVQAATYFPKWVSVDILDGQAWRDGNRLVLFEGRAVADSRVREITPVMPHLIQALFTGFPGASGQTIRVEVPLN